MTVEIPTIDDEALVGVKAALEAAEAQQRLGSDIALAGDGWSMQGRGKSMVRMNGKELPDRIKAWRTKSGIEQTLPTAQLAYHLAKRHPDGSAVFTMTKPDIEPKYIKNTCEFCLELGVRKKFDSEVRRQVHMRAKHPDEWEITQEQTRRVPTLLEAVATMSAEERTLLTTMISGGKTNGREEEVTCPDCGWHKQTAKPEAALSGHRIHCPNRQVASLS